MKKVILSVLALGALAFPVIAVEQPKELVYAVFTGLAPESREVTAKIAVVEGGLTFKVLDKEPLFIPFEAMPLLEKSYTEMYHR